MGQIVGAIAGMSAACTALEFPVVSGNVSLYNETEGGAILPTPVIGGVGLIDDWRRTARAAFTADGQTIILIGETRGWLGGSLFLRHMRDGAAGAPPPVDLDAERRAGDLVRLLISGAKVDQLPRYIRWRASRGGGRDGDRWRRRGGHHRR